MQKMLNDYDVISLNEVKTPLPVAFPGFISVRSKVIGAGHRGGTVVMIRNCFKAQTKVVDTTVDDQVWLQFTCVPKVMFGFCYIPPQDSEYYSHHSFAKVQEKMKANPTLSLCVIGDLNARLGKCVSELPRLACIPHAHPYTYPVLADNVTTQNENATILSALCIDEKMLVVNNLKTHCQYFL